MLANNFCGDSLLRYMIETSERNTSDGPVTYKRAYFDAMGRPKYEQQLGFSGALSTVLTMYDDRGNVAAKSMPYYAGSGTYNGITSSYDLLSRVTEISQPVSDVDPSFKTVKTEYSGLKLKRTDELNHVQIQYASAWGVTLRTIDELTNATNYKYNAFDELRSVTDPASNSTSIDYNIRGFRESTTDPDMGTWQYTYDALGNVLTQTDAKGQPTVMIYDVVGRLWKRTDPSAPQTEWHWDTATNGIGQLGSVSLADSSYTESYTYDSAGRRTSVTTNTGSTGTYAVDYTYDPSLGSLLTVTYPSSTGARFAVQYSYQNGYLKDVRDASTVGTPLLWEAIAQNARGNVIQESYGNGLQTYLNFDESNGHLNYVQTGSGGGTSIQNLYYQWDRVGNLLSRRDAIQSITEAFTYDPLNRLTAVQGNGASTLAMTYDNIGNITSKSDVGTTSHAYDYTTPQAGCSYTGLTPQPHAVRQAGTGTGNTSYCYDKNGNMTSRGGASVTWTTYNYPAVISESGGNSSTFSYAPDRSRYRQIAVRGSVTEDRITIGGLFEKTTIGSIIEYRHDVKANGKIVAIHKRTSGGSSNLYVHDDHLGSTDVITTQVAAIHVRLSYDVWGRRRGSNWTGVPSASDKAAIDSSTHRGFTGQEQLDNLELVHLNGRVYDPVLARFVSADPIVQDPYRSQSFNRYSYTWNNPLNATDPTGLECTGTHIRNSGFCNGGFPGTYWLYFASPVANTVAAVLVAADAVTRTAQAATGKPAVGGVAEQNQADESKQLDDLVQQVVRKATRDTKLFKNGNITQDVDAEGNVTVRVRGTVAATNAKSDRTRAKPREMYKDVPGLVRKLNETWTVSYEDKVTGTRTSLIVELEVAKPDVAADIQIGVTHKSGVPFGSRQGYIFTNLKISMRKNLHEFGHVLGLDDQYETFEIFGRTFRDDPLPGFENDIMGHELQDPSPQTILGLAELYK